MVDLVATSPCAELLPITVGTVELVEMDSVPLTALSALEGDDALSQALEKAHGVALPKPGRSTSKSQVRCLWFGAREVMLVGAAPDPALSRVAAIVDQSDAWARVRIHGTGTVDVLARLIPLDLRDQVFKRGHTARVPLKHMQASVTKLGQDDFMLMVFRSMAGTLVHDFKAAMAAVASRG